MDPAFFRAQDLVLEVIMDFEAFVMSQCDLLENLWDYGLVVCDFVLALLKVCHLEPIDCLFRLRPQWQDLSG